MSKINKKIMWILTILSYAGILICYPRLPERIPIHWNVRWEIDNWGSKNHLLFIGLLPVIILITFDSIIKYRHGEVNRKHFKVYQLLKAAVILLLILLNWMTVVIALGVPVKASVIMPVFLGIFFIVLGNYMPALKSNYFMGIRNPWTLSDEFIWRKTHKAGGLLFILLGLLMFLMSFIQNTGINMIILALLLISAAGINIYSYLLYRKCGRNS